MSKQTKQKGLTDKEKLLFLISNYNMCFDKNFVDENEFLVNIWSFYVSIMESLKIEFDTDVSTGLVEDMFNIEYFNKLLGKNWFIKYRPYINSYGGTK